MINKISKEFSFQQKFMNLLEKQQSIISSNIANSDTPGYIAKEIKFENELSKLLEKNNRLKLLLTSKKHINYKSKNNISVYNKKSQKYMDKNNVDLDKEKIDFVNNFLKYQASIVFINMQVKSLMTALSK